jgi:hypothetical protein
MAVTLTADVLEDQLAVSLARVLAAANKQARQSGTSSPLPNGPLMVASSGELTTARKTLWDGAAAI